MNRQNFALILILFSTSLNISIAGETGFDEICKIYTEVKNTNMTTEMASKYIFDNVKVRINSADALQTHEAIISALADKRYTFFKESAEHYLKKK